jgi:hypothetical protein
MLRFPYQDEALTGPPPPSLPAGAVVRWRPLVPVTIFGPGGLFRDFGRAVVDPAADDTVFPLDTVQRLGIALRPDTGHRIRWRGQLHPLRFGDANLLLTDNGSVWRWPPWLGSRQHRFAIPFWDRPVVCISSMHAFWVRTRWSNWKPIASTKGHAHNKIQANRHHS